MKLASLFKTNPFLLEDTEIRNLIVHLFKFTHDHTRDIDLLKYGTITLYEDAKFFKFAKNSYLPVAKQMDDYLHGRIQLSEAEKRRLIAKFGGVSRWMKAHQRNTLRGMFKMFIDLIPSDALKPSEEHFERWFDLFWYKFSSYESRLAQKARR